MRKGRSRSWSNWVAVEEAMRMVLTDEISDVISKAAIMQYVLEQRGP